MLPGGPTEILWHFAGHFKIIHDIARDRMDYDPSAFHSKPDDYVTPRPEYVFAPDFEDLASHGLSVPPLAPFDELDAGRIHPIRLLSTHEPQPELDPLPRLSGPPIRFGGGGGGGGGGLDKEISVTYQPGGEQTLAEINQYNLASDVDVMLQGCGQPAIDGNIAELSVHSEAVLHDMADGANSVIPAEWWITQSNQGVIEFLRTSDAERDDTPAPNSVEPGYYLNGVLQEPAPDAPLPTLKLYEKPDFGHDAGQWAVTGENTSLNAALLVDLTESGQTMVVLGDYFSTNAIFQTNSLIDNDKADVTGGDAPELLSGNNKADNIADFIQHDGLYADVSAKFSGWHWHVDVVEGDYYSVHTVTQINLLLDNDVVVQSASDSHYEAVSGANGQINLTEVFDGTTHYDLIIVEGAYHGMNVIFQNNILLDNDEIQQVADGLDSSHVVDSGNNELINAATIENFGGDNFQSMNDGMSDIVGALSSGAASLDPELGRLLAGSDGVLNVLYVKGDYYDVNAVWQTNVTSDVDVILQLFDDSGTQSASAGGNNLVNEAAIVDVGATDTYVDGDVYTDTILVQANLLPTDLDKAVNGDTETLITELVAFVEETQNDTPAAPPLACQPTDDAIANVMH